MKRSRETGAALVIALLVSFILSLSVGAVVAYSAAHYRNEWAKSRSEAALLLAEGAIDDELALVSRRINRTNLAERSTPPTQLNGQPYRGRVFSMTGVPGQAWVYTSADRNGTTAWNGRSSDLWIHATANVNGSLRRVRINCNGGRSSFFGDFTMFGVDNAAPSNAPAIGITGNVMCEIVGTIGTNSRIQTGNGAVSWLSALNANTAGTGQQQFTNAPPNAGKPLFQQEEPIVFPSVTQVYENAFGTTDWNWIVTNNNNDRVRMLNGSAITLTPSGTRSAGFTTAQNVLDTANLRASGTSPLMRVSQATNGNSTRYAQGSFTSVTAGSDGRRRLIFPPGDYYFTDFDAMYDAAFELVIDDAGLTVGGNPSGMPVRFWLNGGGNRDNLQVRMSFTGAPGSRFRVYSNKGGSTFELSRPNQFPAGAMPMAGAFYGVTNNPSNPVTFALYGDTNQWSNRIEWIGSAIAERLELRGNVRVVADTGANISWTDPGSGIGFVGGYEDGF